MAVTDEVYYGDESLHGGYQYVTIEEVINNYLMSRVEDDFTVNVPRYKILYQAMRGLRELTFDVVKDIRAIELELDPNTLSVTLPTDYINYVRISVVDEFGQLIPMTVDNNLSIAKEYLQDSSYDLLFDNDGCVLQGDSSNSPTNEVLLSDDNDECSRYTFHSNFRPNLDTSKVYDSGRYVIDKRNGLIKFGSSVGGKDIVLEYISDGLFTGCEGLPENEIRVHKFAESALLSFIYYELIRGSRSVPANAKQLARKEYWNDRRLAKLRISTLRPKEILQAMRKSSVWIKP